MPKHFLCEGGGLDGLVFWALGYNFIRLLTPALVLDIAGDT